MTVKIILYSRGEYSRAKEMRGGSRFVDTAPGAKRKGRRLAKRERERESRNSFMENSRFFISVPRFLPYGWVARHSSLGFTPLVPRPREGEGRKFGTYGGKARRGAYFIYYFARRRAWRTLGGMGEEGRREIGSSQQGGLPTELNVTAPGCLRGPLSRYTHTHTLSPSVETLHRRGTKNPCTPSSRGPPPALIF